MNKIQEDRGWRNGGMKEAETETKEVEDMKGEIPERERDIKEERETLEGRTKFQPQKIYEEQQFCHGSHLRYLATNLDFLEIAIAQSI